MTTSAMVHTFAHSEYGIMRSIEIDGEIWFDPRVPCDALELMNRPQALSRLHEADKKLVHRDIFSLDKGVSTVDAPSAGLGMHVINESGLYDLILDSRKEQARAFRRWLTKEVIPEIARTGRYVVPGSEVAPDPLSPESLRALADHVERLAEAEPKAEKHDRVMEVDGGWYVATVGRMFGYDSPHAFHDYLRSEGATYRDKRQTPPSLTWINKGWMTRRGTTAIITADGLEELERRLDRSALGLGTSALAIDKPSGKLNSGVAAMHMRWHVNRGIKNPDCPLCA